jgi:hypothetical protein
MSSNNTKTKPEIQITTTSLSLNVTPDQTDNLSISKPSCFYFGPKDNKIVTTDLKTNSTKFENKDFGLKNKVSLHPLLLF